MSSPFQGYLIAAVKEVSGVTTYIPFPNQYIQFDSYSSNPKQREEIKAYRDDNTRELYRVTAEGKKSKITFTVRPLNLAQKMAFQSFFYDNEVDHVQRKIQIKYWDDDSNTYSTGYFYRPNMEFPINHITADDIKYKEFKMELIEY